ncbi:MAG: hypothetical protein N3A60_11155 [Thermanaerothrix sp.]|nr:hypothetical protein [Thermanaerothrix sp.]
MTLLTQTINTWFESLPTVFHRHRGILFGALLLVALVGFELFNYSTTYVALHDLLGDLSFGPLQWATILAIAFCAIDFAGIARLFTPEQGENEPREIWYLFGAWLLAATMNAVLTWWSVSLALVEHTPRASAFINADLLIQVVPLFIAILVWVTRILLIGTLTLAGQRLFASQPSSPQPMHLQAGSRAYERMPSTDPRRASMPLTPAPSIRHTTPVQAAPSRREPVYVDEEAQVEPTSRTGARFL